MLPSGKTSFAASLDRHFLRRSVLSQCTGTCGRPGGAPDQNEYKKPPKHCRTAVYRVGPPLRFSRQVCTHIRAILLLERTRSLELKVQPSICMSPSSSTAQRHLFPSRMSSVPMVGNSEVGQKRASGRFSAAVPLDSWPGPASSNQFSGLSTA